jgi:hypothetical protein
MIGLQTPPMRIDQKSVGHDGLADVNSTLQGHSVRSLLIRHAAFLNVCSIDGDSIHRRYGHGPYADACTDHGEDC